MKRVELIAIALTVLSIAADLGGYAPSWVAIPVAVVGAVILIWSLLRKENTNSIQSELRVTPEIAAPEPTSPPQPAPKRVHDNTTEVVSLLAAYRHRFDDFHAEVRRVYRDGSQQTEISKLVRETYDVILRVVTDGEAELFVDRTNLQIPKSGPGHSAFTASEEQSALIHNAGVYSKRLTELITRVRQKNTA